MDQVLELQKFGVQDAAIAKWRADFLPLVITGIDDMAGFKKVHESRMIVKNKRVDVMKIGKEMRAEAVAWQKAVLAEENRILAMIKPIEEHLQTEEDKIENEKARIKAEAEAKEAERIQARSNRLFDFGARFDGQNYSTMGLLIPAALVKACTDDQFEQFCAEIQKKVDEETARKAQEEAARKAKEERLAKICAEQEAERKRLEDERRKQEEEAARIKREQEAIEAEKKRLVDAEAARLKVIEDEKKRKEEEKRRAEELERAKVEAAEKARKEEAERIEKEAKAKAEREEKERIAKERKEARRPDKEKLLAFAELLSNLQCPAMKTKEGQSVLNDAKDGLDHVITTLKTEVEAM